MSIDGKYTIELFRDGGESKGIEAVLASDDRLKIARTLYRAMCGQYPGRLIMLCERARVLARSDRPDEMPD
jgi:hypothetical protein